MQPEPLVAKHGWHVHTTDSTFGRTHGQGVWFWHAWGPRGHQTGVESEADTAVFKAHAASYVLADPERTAS